MKLRNKIKFIYFDLDNTLWDFKRNSKVALKSLYDKKIKTLEVIDIPFDTFQEIYSRNNETMWRAYERGEVTPEILKIERFNKTIKELGLTGLVEGKELNDDYITSLPQLPHLVPHAREILEYLFPNYPLGILSNGFKDSQYQKLDSAKIKHFFQFVITSDVVGVSKPHPDIFRYAIEKSGYKPEEIAYVGDDYQVDALAANKMDITGILFDPHNKVEDNSIIQMSDLIELQKYL